MPRTLLSGGGLRKPGVTRSLPTPAPAEPGTPSGMVSNRLALSKRQLQDKVNYQRGQLIKHGRAQGLGNAQINSYIQKLYANADQKTMQLTQESETQTAGLAELDQFGRIGGVTPEAVSRAKFRMVGGPEADRMIREPGVKDPVADYGKLDVHRNRLETRLAQFEQDPGGKRVKDPWKWWWQEKKEGPILKVYLGKDEDKKDIFRPATFEEQREHETLTQELDLVKKQQNTILGGRDFTNRLRSTAVTSGRMAGGPLGDQVADYMERKQVSPQEPEDFSKMSEEELQQIAGGR